MSVALPETVSAPERADPAPVKTVLPDWATRTPTLPVPVRVAPLATVTAEPFREPVRLRVPPDMVVAP